MEMTLQKVTELATAVGVDRGTIHNWQRNDPAFPKRSAKGWDRAEFIVYARRKLEHAAQRQGGDNAELKTAKLQKQCNLLDVELQRAELARQTEALELAAAQDKNVSMDEHMEVVTELAQILRDGFDQALALVKCQTKDSTMVAIMEQIRRTVCERVLARVKGEA